MTHKVVYKLGPEDANKKAQTRSQLMLIIASDKLTISVIQVTLRSAAKIISIES